MAVLAGEVALTFTDGLTVETLDGTDASTYVERVLRAEYDELRLAVVGAPQQTRAAASPTESCVARDCCCCLVRQWRP